MLAVFRFQNMLSEETQIGFRSTGCPFASAQGCEGNWRKEGSVASTVAPIQSNEILVEALAGDSVAKGESLRQSFI